MSLYLLMHNIFKILYLLKLRSGAFIVFLHIYIYYLNYYLLYSNLSSLNYSRLAREPPVIIVLFGKWIGRQYIFVY